MAFVTLVFALLHKLSKSVLRAAQRNADQRHCNDLNLYFPTKAIL